MTDQEKIQEELAKIPFLQQKSALSIAFRIGIVIVATLFVVQLVHQIWKKHFNEREDLKIHHRFLYNILVIFVYIIGFIVAVSQINGASNVLGMIIAGSGFAALGIGLAAQESLGNLINGIVLTISKPFEVGDRIHLVNGNITGYVEDITLRHTVMRTFVNSRIIIPNSTINKDMIENSNYQIAQASSFVDVIITFDSDLDLAREIMAQAIGDHPMFLDRRTEVEKETVAKVKVFVRDLGLNGMQLRGSMWTEDVNDNFEACSDARYQIKKSFDKVGILLAQVPSRPTEYARAGAIPSESGNYPNGTKIINNHTPDESEDIAH